jgi:hypothetical protein
MDNNREYFQLSGRVQIPAISGSVPGSATLKFTANYPILDSIELFACSSTFLNNAGVIIQSSEGILYPAVGSKSDSNFAGKEQYGMIPPLTNVLRLPLNRKLNGNAWEISFTFYNDGASPLPVSILLTCAKENQPLAKIELREKE